jgi:hypothetical protein
MKMTNMETKTKATITEKQKTVSPERINLLWHSFACIELDKIDTAVVALQHLNVHGDPDGALAVIDCVQSYLLDIKEYLAGHHDDLGNLLKEVLPE